jgi:hypothetical protein
MKKLIIYDVAVKTTNCQWIGTVASETARQARKMAEKAAGIEYAIQPKQIIETHVSIAAGNFEIWVQV